MISNTLPLSLTDNPILSQWIAFEPGKVRIATGKVEIGQGILTAMTQIAAEELDVRPDQVRLVSGETDVSPSEYFTSGSYSVSVGGAAIRLVCAEVRAMLTDKVAEALGCKASEISIEEGQFLRGGKATGRDYWSMAGNDQSRPAGERHRADQEPVEVQDRRHKPAAARPAGQGQGRGLYPRHRGGGRRARPDAAAAVEGRAACLARRGGGAQGGRERRSTSFKTASSSPSREATSRR